MSDWYFMNLVRNEITHGTLDDVLRRLMELIHRCKWSTHDKINLVELCKYELDGLKKQGWKFVGLSNNYIYD